ncbi:DNA polymerase alpha-associated DNA helicase A-like [Trichogramma pretiosum]|uniref:DNA polymerase alpha-associated DNA helicase A-like n=1 Tax=Trichogramma pretiosum TaxID=7493 RepID=UPI0006C9BB4D|nr:DNA polymerase alpha-associated DNA helicase A-like [Trichogramma pretiosum]
MSATVLNVPVDYTNEEYEIKLKNGQSLRKELQDGYSITQKMNETAFYRMKQALTKLKKLDQKDEKLGYFVSILLNRLSVIDNTNEKTNSISTKNLTGCNERQIEAIQKALDNNLFLIHGPPGTGKSHTCLKIIHALREQSPTVRILVCAGSNMSVDLIAKKLTHTNIDVIRLYSQACELSKVSLPNLTPLSWVFKLNPILKDLYERREKGELNDQEKLNFEEQLTNAENIVFTKIRVVLHSKESGTPRLYSEVH